MQVRHLHPSYHTADLGRLAAQAGSSYAQARHLPKSPSSCQQACLIKKDLSIVAGSVVDRLPRLICIGCRLHSEFVLLALNHLRYIAMMMQSSEGAQTC